MKRIIVFTFVLILVCISVNGCQRFDSKYGPQERPYTQWMSEDGNIFIRSDEDGYSYGYIQIGDEKIPAQFNFTGFGIVWVNGYTSTGSIISLEYEKWGVRFKENYFTAKVESTTFFKKNQKFVFHKLEDDEKIDYEPLSFSSESEGIRYENTIDKNADFLYPLIERYATRDDYESHIIAIAFNFAGVKNINDAEIVDSTDDFIVVKAVADDGDVYYATYYLKLRKVDSINKSSIDGERVY